MSTGDMFPEAHRPVPPGSTPSWFTDRKWFLLKEAELIKRRLLPGPTLLDTFGHPLAPVSKLVLERGGEVWTKEDDFFHQVSDHSLGWWASLRDRLRSGCGFFNPPYDAETMDRALGELLNFAEMGITTWGLIPSLTDRAWWHRHLEHLRRENAIVIEFEEGRHTFGWPENPEHVGADSATFPSAVVVVPA